MRIISGKHKGKRLLAPKNLPVRPTTDFAKEALFNILNNYFDFHQISVIDLFAGTGNISYEFASRGTTQITAVEKDSGCVTYISQVSKQLDFPIQTVKSDVYPFLQKTRQSVDVIFADPPYQFTQDQLEAIIHLVFENDLLQPQGLLVIEHPKQLDFTSNPYFMEERKYGGSKFTFFEPPALTGKE